jgi:6-phosphogluconolactonase (cycloisomerase 2 family)
MKTKSIVAGSIMMLASIFTYAIDPSESQFVVFNQKETGLFKVIYQGTGKQTVTMKIYGQEGKVVFKESINSTKGFNLPVNFTGMEAGEYIIEIEDENGKKLQKVSYGTETKIQSVHVSKVNEDGKYLFAAKSNGAERINVNIFDGEGNLIHNQSLMVNGDLGLIYNLQRVVGTPTFEVTDNTGSTKVVK